MHERVRDGVQEFLGGGPPRLDDVEGGAGFDYSAFVEDQDFVGEEADAEEVVGDVERGGVAGAHEGLSTSSRISTRIETFEHRDGLVGH